MAKTSDAGDELASCGGDEFFAILAPFGADKKIFSFMGRIPGNDSEEFLALEQFRWTALCADKEPGPFVLTFNSPGGDGDAMFFLLDVLGNLRSSVVTVACCAQSAAAVLCTVAATPGQRYVYPNSMLMLHNGRFVLPDAEEKHYMDKSMNPRLARLIDRHCNVNRILADRSTAAYPPSEEESARIASLLHLLDHEQIFTAEEALSFGLADQLMDSETERRLLLPSLPPVQLKRTRRVTRSHHDTALASLLVRM